VPLLIYKTTKADRIPLGLKLSLTTPSLTSDKLKWELVTEGVTSLQMTLEALTIVNMYMVFLFLLPYFR
ncbi:MAG: hypothetical protein ABF239_05395, partial [Wenyingzhuangia sp.]